MSAESIDLDLLAKKFQLNQKECQVVAAISHTVCAQIKACALLAPMNGGYPARMPAEMVCERLGISRGTLNNSWKDRGLKVKGRNRHGNIFCGASVARHANENSQYLHTK